jgi:Tfp pilus assembly protein PilX
LSKYGGLFKLTNVGWLYGQINRLSIPATGKELGLKHRKSCGSKARQKSANINSETGYVLAWVLIFALVASLIIGPFLQFMITSVRASHSYAETMAKFYAADSGIEDALYKIQSQYAATTFLTSSIQQHDTTILVDNSANFPEMGIIQIEAELVYYGGKNDTETAFTECIRGYGGTNATSHDEDTPVLTQLPKDPGESWHYSLEDVNGKQVDVTIESLWLLEGLEDDSNGTMPHAELTVTGQSINIPTTVLRGDIGSGDNIIPVLSTRGFPDASLSDPSLVRIEDELVLYVDKTGDPNPTFVVADEGRGYGSSIATNHSQNTTVISEEVTYRVDISYDNSKGNLKIDKVGVWLPGGFSYVPGSSNIATTLSNPIFDTTTGIRVVNTQLFPDSGVIAIENELIRYSSKTAEKFEDCERGYAGTTAADHLTVGTPVSAEPQPDDRPGTLNWVFGSEPGPGVNFVDLPSAPAMSGEGSFQSGIEVPIKRSIALSYTPAGDAKGIFSWVRTTRNDVYLSWSGAGGIYRVTANATDPDSGTHTALESYVASSSLTSGVSVGVGGDARVIGNSLMKDNDSDGIRDELIAESSATISDIPDDANVEAAYLYWSGWKGSPEYTGSDDNARDLAEQVNQVTFNGTLVTADRVQILENGAGWSYSSLKDVTSLLNPDTVANINVYPEATPGSITITNTGSGTADILITSHPDNPGSMYIDEIIEIPVGSSTIPIDIPVSSFVLLSGTTGGTYNATIDVTGMLDEVTVGSTTIDKNDETPWPISTETVFEVAQVLPEITIKKLTANAYIDYTAFQTPANMELYDANGELSDVILPGETKYNLWLNSIDDSYMIRGTSYEPYKVNIAVTDGKVEITSNSESIVLGEPGSQITNGTFTVGSIEADILSECSYAGWSLILIYSSQSEEAHQFYLYDTFLYADTDTAHAFAVTSFLAPSEASDIEATVTYFVGEGDESKVGDYARFNGTPLDATDNPSDNVMNSYSTVVADGIDIDTFDVKDYVSAGDTSAVVELGTGDDIWNLVYLLLSFRTQDVNQSGEREAGIITYSFEGS